MRIHAENAYGKSQPESTGVRSIMLWTNPKLRTALENMLREVFSLTDTEVISDVTITPIRCTIAISRKPEEKQ